MKEVEGKITISRVSCNNQDDYMKIEIEDVSSSCRIMNVEIPLNAFANAITGLSYQSCKLQVYTEAPVGMKREMKEVILPRSKNYTVDLEKQRIVAEKVAKPFEVDGWKLHWYKEYWNHHNYVGQDQVKVNFIRFVDR